MNFLYPQYLWYAMFLLPYLMVLPYYYRRQLSVLHLLCSHSFNEAMRHAYLRYFTLLASFAALFVLSLILALAKPLWGRSDRVEIKRQNFQIVFLLDISRSMLARDVTPSRFKRAVTLLSELYEMFRNNELGLVVFKGSPQTLVPLSQDQLVFPTLFSQLDTDILQTPGSNVAAAIEEGMELFDEKSHSSRIMILLSDGESLSGDFGLVQKRLRAWNGTLISIGIGTKKGTELLDQEGNIITNYQGLPVYSRLEDAILKDLSGRTFGKYYHIQELNLVQKLQRELAPLSYGHRILQYDLRDRYQFFVALSLLSFLILALLKRFGFMGYYRLVHSQESFLKTGRDTTSQPTAVTLHS